MFVAYTGWGYWNYELDWQQMELENPSGAREPDQYIKCRLFELPDFAKKAIALQGYAEIDYLLPTDDSEEDMDIRYPYINTPNFYICSDTVNYDKYGYPEERETIKIIIATKDFLTVFSDRKVFLVIESIESVLSKPENVLSKSAKNRKKLIPLQRETNSALILLYDFFKHYTINYSDECTGLMAWDRIQTCEFSSKLIKSISKNEIILNGEEKLTKSDFLEKYRKRFK